MHIPCIPIYSISRIGQNRIYTPYMTVYLMISLPKIPYIHRIYMVLANPKYFWQGNYPIYSHVRCIYVYTVLANPTCDLRRIQGEL